MIIAKPTGMASLEYFQGLRIQDRHSGQSGAQTRSPEQNDGVLQVGFGGKLLEGEFPDAARVSMSRKIRWDGKGEWWRWRPPCLRWFQGIPADAVQYTPLLYPVKNSVRPHEGRPGTGRSLAHFQP